MGIVEIDNLRVNRNGRTICRVSRLSIEPRDRIAVIGKNGSGKTTLLRVLAGLERDHEGTCEVEVSRRERIYVDQNPYLFRGTVLSNAMYGLRARGMTRKAARTRAMDWLDKFGVRGLAGSNVFQISGGERRRAALARAIAIEPPLLLLDEPLAEMDSEGAALVQQVLADLRDATILLTSPIRLAKNFAARNFCLDGSGADSSH